MRFEEIIKDVRKGKPFTDGCEKYRYNKRKHYVERWETDLRYIDGHKKPFWDKYDADNVVIDNRTYDQMYQIMLALK